MPPDNPRIELGAEKTAIPETWMLAACSPLGPGHPFASSVVAIALDGFRSLARVRTSRRGGA